MPGRAYPWGIVLVLLLAGRAVAADDFVGAERCGSCHRSEYQDWKRSAHASALARLSKVQQQDATCRSCHTMVPNSDDPELAGVQCESCHGAGRLYEPDYVMRDKKLADLLGLEAIEATTCAPCHTGDAPTVQPFTFAEKVELVRHKKAGSPAETTK